jgi:hypothetical protein
MISKRFPEILLLTSTAAAALAAFSMPQTKNEKTTLEIQGPIDFREYFSLRRNYFFGHKEMSDIVTGMSVLSNTVDAFANSKMTGFENSKIRARFDDSMMDAKFLSRFAIGMNDIYIFPALYFLFEEQNPERALELVQLGMRDSRTDVKVPLLGAFISHVFERNLQTAGRFYKTLYEKYPTPEWINDLANKLLAGEDPYLSSPRLRSSLDEVIKRTFPKARSYFEKQEEKRRRGENK